jgi:hypothetical protein
MKAIKYILSTVLLIAIVWSCTKVEDNFDFVSTAKAPANITAQYSIAQDNSGLVTITPNGDGAISYDVTFGDNTADPASVKQGQNVKHTYAEGNYQVEIAGIGITGLKTEVTQDLVVSFKAPKNLVVVIENDLAVSKKVNVMANADFATFFDVYFGEVADETPVSANIGETASFIYQEAGTYTIRVVAKGGAIATTEYTEEFVVTAIMQPLASAAAPPSRQSVDVISIYSSVYSDIAGTNYNPDWGQSGQGSGFAEFDLNGDLMLQYINLSYQGIGLGETVDVSAMEFLHMDVWTADVDSIETSLINGQDGNSTEKPVWSKLTKDEWTSIDIPISAYTDQGLTVSEIFQLKFVGDPWAGGTVFIDNIYFHKAPSAPSALIGTWKMAPEAAALMVGPTYGNGDWWTSDDQAVIDRACLFDDTYVFSADGSFSNVLGTDTWLEAWQGTADACGTPVAPYDGTAVATFSHNQPAGTVTINGLGAYLGIPKANNAGELPNVDVPTSITYDVTLSDNDNTLTIVIEAGSGVFWTYKLIRDEAAPPPPIVGTWKFAPESGVMGVGPAIGDYSWWSNNEADVATRACLFDDAYVFNADGTFSNVLGAETWLEPWQGVDPEACGTPVAPHDGSNPATWTASDNSITINGLGAYLGLAKVHNTGEDGSPVDNTITYNYVLSSDGNSLEITVELPGAAWYFKLVRVTNPLIGTWKFAPESEAMGVGPAIGDYSWWSNNEADVATRACLFDDEYVFSADGTFSNVLGAETWIEPWQGVDPEACGTPVAPHDGSSPATWTSSDNSITINGLGAYLGLAKVHNTGEDGSPVDNTITYNYVLSSDGNSLELTIALPGAAWYFKLVK